MQYRLIFLLALLILAACSENVSGLQQAVTAESLATPTLPPTATVAPTVAETTPESLLPLTVWMPEPLAPPNNQAAALVLASQLDNFQAAESGLQVIARLKQVEGSGGLLATLLSASQVAPSALPDLTLIRRQDLGMMVQEGLIQLLDGRLSAGVMDDFYTAALRLGQVNNRLYGLPYALVIQHVAYEPPQEDFARFDSVLEAGRPLVIPAGQVNGLNDVFLVQYVAAGGTLLNGNLGSLNVEALRTALEFYEAAVTEGVIDPGVLNYPTPQDYQAGLVDGRITAAVVTSGMYLDLLTAGKEFQTDSIPVSSGRPTTVVDGWMWVMTAKDTQRQAMAVQFLEWMFEAGRHAGYTRAISMLPSGQAAMRGWGNPAYVEFADSLLSNAVLPLTDNENNATARAIQNAFVSVISGERSADQATQDVIEQLAG